MDKHINVNYIDRSATVQVSNEVNGVTLVAEPTVTSADWDWYLWLDQIDYAVWKPSIEGGHLEIVDQDGTVRWKINTDGIKENSVSFGHSGIRVGQNGYLVAAVSGSPQKQASVSISVKAHTTRHSHNFG